MGNAMYHPLEPGTSPGIIGSSLLVAGFHSPRKEPKEALMPLLLPARPPHPPKSVCSGSEPYLKLFEGAHAQACSQHCRGMGFREGAACCIASI